MNEGDDSNSRGSTGGDDVSDDDFADDTLDDNDDSADDSFDDDTGCTNPYCVEEQEDIGADWSCPDPAGCYCIEDYEDFVLLAAPYGHVMDEEDLAQRFENALAAPIIEETIPSEELRQAVVEATSIGFLIEAINERRLIVTTVSFSETDDYLERRLLFTDPYVGTFKGLFLTPKSADTYPVVIAIHGHGSSPADYRDHYHGAEYPAQGLGILMLSVRVLCNDEAEDNVTRSMLLNSFSFIGVQVYETLLALKYLLYLDSADDERIGLIGHSGGSAISNLTVEVEPTFKAYVSDDSVPYLADTASVDDKFDHSILPELRPYSFLINNFSCSPTPVLTVPYGYTDGMEEILDFFNEHLSAR